ncbi:MAG TPA: SDR family NAD(P)-dependent oxidoreductase [Solirubrobacteraceae bacterium]
MAGRRILITGAARGIGEATARRLSSAGAHLALLDLERPGVEMLARELNGLPLHCDVVDEHQTRVAVDTAAERLGGLDVVIANAGIHVHARTDVIASADFRRVLEVDLLGVWHTLRPSIPYVAQTGGYMLSVASLAATLHLPMLGAYSAAKAGIHALANVMRLELRSHGIAVGCAYFGRVDTDLLRETSTDSPPTWRSLSRWAPKITAERAARGITDAVARRARWVVLPTCLYPLIALPSTFQLALEPLRR